MGTWWYAYGLYFASGKEKAKQHCLKEPDNPSMKLTTLWKQLFLKVETSKSCWNDWIAKASPLNLRLKSVTNEPQGIQFSKNDYPINGSKVDQQFSFSKIDFALQRNILYRSEARDEHPAAIPESQQEFTSPDSDSLLSSIGGLFSGILTPGPAYDPEEATFRRQMQRKKKRKKYRR